MPQPSNRTQRIPNIREAKTCKTCVSCRVKKVRCCGTRPKCTECVNDDLDCVYPQDARSQPRPSRARLRTLEATVTNMLEYMKASGIAAPDSRLEQWISGTHPVVGLGAPSFRSPPGSRQGLLELASAAAGTYDMDAQAESTPAPLLQPSDENAPTSIPATLGEPGEEHRPVVHFNAASPQVSPCDDDQATGNYFVGPGLSVDGSPSFDPNSSEDRARQNRGTEATSIASLSPGEARLAAILRDDGCISSVHGLTSVLNHMPRREPTQKRSNEPIQELVSAAVKARLISYAALQNQRESWIYNQPRIKVDFDGCDPGLAKHLLDLHFNRFHYAYLISYRPAIIDSLASGGGPWVNNLLLNAIFYSSSLFSDRSCLQADPDDPQSIGAHFYDRFCQLLGKELSKPPSIPTAAALLLTSSSLVSHGRSSAGWNLSGLAYRMVIDLGCHLTLEPSSGNESGGHSESTTHFNDVEQEMRKRLYWGAMAIDATQALFLGRPCMLAPIEARVPLSFLDTFEELEKWEPYIDPETPSSRPPAYTPQPAYGVSTFIALSRLFQIATRIIQLYGINAIRSRKDYIQQELMESDQALQHWSASLPNHLRFDPDGPSIPPPHQIVLHAAFHALTILLHRAFLENGHLWHHSNDSIRRRSEDTCTQSALSIGKYVLCYRDTFTLRGAPFMLSYAAYSAVVIILDRERHRRGDYVKLISFYWTCLSELQQGCNFGMKKPLTVLKDMVREYEISVKETGAGRPDDDSLPVEQTGLDESFFSALPVEPSYNHSTLSEQAALQVSDGFMPHGGDLSHPHDPYFTSTQGTMGYIDGQESTLWHDTLYGLFTTSLPFG